MSEVDLLVTMLCIVLFMWILRRTMEWDVEPDL
jgi:hypothetical protein